VQHVDRPLKAEEIRNLVGSEPVIVEIGSHEGTDTLRFLEAMPGARIYCFEPEQRAIARFKAIHHLDQHPQVTLYETAVADINGIDWFYPSTGKAGEREDWDFSGSLNKPTGHLSYSPEIKFKPPIKVSCIRLDTWLASEDVGWIDFIWADVQGSQRKLIAGGWQALTVTSYVYIECHRQPLYEQEPTQPELMRLLPGFHAITLYDGDNILFRNKAAP